MSKKIASGADKILIDIKVGNGALLDTKEKAKELSDLMIKIGKIYDKEVRCIISDMNTPLGYSVGNSLEVLEAIDVLKGEEKSNSFVDLCIDLASEMVSMGLNISKEEAKSKVINSINDGSAYNKFIELVEAQGGDIKSLKVSNRKYSIKANKNGTLKAINALEIGKLSLGLGAGKLNIKDKIDYTVGVKLNKLVGEEVKKGDVLATLYVNRTIPTINVDEIFTIK